MPQLRRLLGLGLLLLLVPAILGTEPAASARGTALTWEVDLRARELQVVNLSQQAGGLTLGTQDMRHAAYAQRRYGMLTTPIRSFARPIVSVAAQLGANVPAGATVQVDVRGRSAGAWTEWRTATQSHPALLPRAVSEVQARLILLADSNGRAPLVRQLSFTAQQAGSQEVSSQSEPLTYTIYATREGLVGETTANGHVITEYDRFVALPSHRALCADDTNPCEYMVELYYPKTGKRVQAPVWDIGPWNTKDDYWNPAHIREMWQDLPQGKPEAQAAYQDGYNGGKDQFGRTVLNPAGIDLADGTFWLDLGMSDNDWVEVTYLWTSGASTWEATVDNATSGRFSASSNWGTSSWSDQRYGADYRYTTPETAFSDPVWYKFDIPETASYEVYVWYPANSGYNSATPYIVKTPNSNEVIYVDQRVNGGQWNSIGTFSLAAGDYNAVGVSRWTSGSGYIIADAIKLVRR